jgi:hypothetical protein
MMTLPWLKRKMASGGSMTITQDEHGSLNPMSENEEGLKSAASDLLMAIENKNPSQVANALKAAFEICESYEDMSEPEGE